MRVAFVVMVMLLTAPLLPAAERVDFARDVRPILVKHCLACHGGVQSKGGLTLVSAEHVRRRKEPVLVPGRPAESELYRRIVSADEDERMPEKHPPLKPLEIETIRRWIEQGAEWGTHWAFDAVKPPRVPAVADERWVRNPIDAFVFARLKARGLRPSSEADRPALIRRLSLDLTGLPPTPAEVDAFVRDERPDAYERIVERLLASKHYGERWGRHWLDVARYADTDGYEVDGTRPNAWVWRDWVIRAINDDVPFDRFTVEQLAGDLLPSPTPDQRLATGFHRNTLTNKEGGIDAEEYRVYAVMDRVGTTAGVWLGLTMGCAQCHDHPYDPVTQREHYALFAFFNDADEAVLQHEGRKLDVMAQRKEPRTTHLLERGDFLTPKKDEAIPPAVLGALHPFNARGARPDRLDLANWLVDPANPLVRRVAVNRIWQHLFGVGLVATPDDFGMSGEPPIHGGLLDWLAGEFLRRGWSQKEMIRLIVASATYRQSSRPRPEVLTVDPTNQLLHRQNRLRVEAEIVRDLNLAAAGLLSPKIGGPSVFPPIPEDLKKIDFRSDMKWDVSKGEDRHRRGMYTFFKRSLPDPNLTMFDCPDAMASLAKRERSGTPLQALARLNNVVFVEAAQALGKRLRGVKEDDRGRIVAGYQICLARPPREEELAALMRLLERSGKHGDETAWTAVAQVLLNLDEFITRE